MKSTPTIRAFSAASVLLENLVRTTDACFPNSSNYCNGSLWLSRFNTKSVCLISKGEKSISPVPGSMPDRVFRREASKIMSGPIGKDAVIPVFMLSREKTLVHYSSSLYSGSSSSGPRSKC